MIEQAKFTYSPLGKAFEKQTKTIEDQGKKQIKVIENNKKQLDSNNADDYKNELLISKEREIFKNIFNERLNRIEEFTKKVHFDNLKYFTESGNIEIDLSAKEDTITFLNNIETNKITTKEAKDSQEDFNKYLKMI